MVIRRIPHQVDDTRLLGGLDLAATLASGRPVGEKGLLSECHGGVAIVATAERMAASTAARFASALDWHTMLIERDGMSAQQPTAFGMVLLDEGIDEEEFAPVVLAERVPFHLSLPETAQHISEWDDLVQEIADARWRLPDVVTGGAAIEALTATAFALGVLGLRAPILALRVARAHAALNQRGEVLEEDLQFAAAAVLASRATQLPEAQADAEDTAEEAANDDAKDQDDAEQATAESDDHEETSAVPDVPMEDVVLEAAQAAIPAGLLARFAQDGAVRRARSRGRSGKLQHGAKSGRPVGVRQGDPRTAGRLNLLATLRAAAPWQLIRRREQTLAARNTGLRAPLVHVRRQDFRINRYQQRAETLTIFAVDASGSAALHRLSEAKGAVELLLADCYVRRDRVAVVAFRRDAAEILLPPTRSLVRAKRGLAALPGGGGTPLAAGIDAARDLAVAARRRGETPLVVVLTDGRANVGRDGKGGRAKAEAEALAAARQIRTEGLTALVIDTSPVGEPQAAAIAKEMAASFLMLPQSDARRLCSAVANASLGLARSQAHA
jgi:magnesium chelatase subunit D